MRTIRDIAEDLMALVKIYVTQDHLEVHEANKLALLAVELDDMADKLEDDGK